MSWNAKLPIILDCDGVLADFQGLACERLGVQREDVTSYDFFLQDERKQAFWALCEDRETWRVLEPLPGAMEGVTRLIDAHQEIVVATASWHSCDGWATERYAWLRKHFGIRPGQVVIGRQKHLLAGRVLVEDRADTLDEWICAQRGRGFIFDAPYNRDFEWSRRPKPTRVTWEEGLAQAILDEVLR